MQILLSCAKDMTEMRVGNPPLVTEPLFQQQANSRVMQLMKYSAGELQHVLKCNSQIAAKNHLRYLHFFDEQPSQAAALSYTGMAYKHLRAADFTKEEFLYAQQHLWITSFLYGLLRPLDGIRTYRLEGNVELPAAGAVTLFDYWKPLLTDVLIDAVKEDDGILVNLASDEMKSLFHWKRVEQALTVIQPEFKVRKGDAYKTIVVYTKMCRGGMARSIIQQHPAQAADLLSFTHEGFEYNERLSHTQHPVFTLE